LNDIERQRKHFNAIAERYRQARSHPNHLRLKDLIWASTLDAAPTPRARPLKVLEPMCGYAEGYDIVAKYLSDDISYSGFDYSSTVTDYLQAQHPDRDILCADATRFESDDVWDVIILIGGLHHVPAYAADVVDRLAKCLAPGGIFINLEPTSGNPLFRWVRERIYQSNTLFDEETERAFEVSELAALFSANGLEPVDQLYPGLLAYVLYYNPDAFPHLNVGTPSLVSFLVNLEKWSWRTALARWFSFATLSLWQKPSESKAQAVTEAN